MALYLSNLQMYLHRSLAAIILLTTGITLSCTETELNGGDPYDLSVEITRTEGSGVVLIRAVAENAVEYQLWIDAGEEPAATNATGVFEHTFTRPGIYRVEIRAYGNSGRYLKETRSVVVDAGSGVTLDDGYTTPATYPGYQLTWFDEFEGVAVKPENWVFETGTGCPDLCGWGNNELQYYRPENARVGDGVLTIEARNETYAGAVYTSARMKTQARRSFKYGRIDVRALLPGGQGIWPAVWMLGDNITSAGWPACGEIDIMEMIGGAGRENQVHGTLHWDDNGHVSAGGRHTLPDGLFSDAYHVFSIIWDENTIRWLVNDVPFHEINITPSHMTEFHEKFFLVLNMAVGGNWPGDPDGTTAFPQQMKVDYIRVFQLIEN